MVADRDERRNWETFALAYQGDSARGKEIFAIQCFPDFSIASADFNKSAILVSDRQIVGPWERFEFVPV